jgi:hypothetical protein
LEKESNISLENEERMKMKLPKLHIQRIKWKPHGRNALCWVFFVLTIIKKLTATIFK